MDNRVPGELLPTVLDTVREGVVIADARRPDLPTVYVNPAFERMTGYRPEEVLGRNCRLLQGRDRDQTVLEIVRRALAEGTDCTVTLRNYRKDGTLFWNELSLAPVRDAKGHLTYWIGVQRDVTARVLAETRLREYKEQLEEANEQLARQVTHDALTSLHSRGFFEKRMETEWRRALRDRRQLSCFMIDIDFFKNYNDAYGHQAGDDCLRRVAAALEDTFRRGSDVVARYGGEEFVAIAAGIEPREAAELAARICARVRRLGIPHRASAVADHVTVSVGVATIVPEVDGAAVTLVSGADRALYRAKESGRDRAVEEPGVDALS